MQHSDKKIFYAYLVLILWLPLPLGSNRDFAVMIMLLSTILLLTLWLVLYWRGHVRHTRTLKHSWPALTLLAIYLLYILLQIIPLPNKLIGVLSPTALNYWDSLRLLELEQANFTLSLSPSTTIGFLLKSLGYAILFVLTLLLVRSHARIKLLLTILVISGALQAVFGSLMVLSGLEYGFFIKKTAYLGMATGTFINRNHLAGYLEMCLAAGIGLMVMNPGERSNNWHQRLLKLTRLILSRKIQVRIALAIMVIGLVMTRSRMGNTAFFASLIITGTLWVVLSGQRPSKPVVLLLISLFIIDLYIVGTWFGVDKVVQRLENTSASHETRDEVVRDSLVYWESFRLTGSGGGTFAEIYPIFKQADVKGYYDHAHNDYIEFAVETGIIGITLLGLFVLATLFSSLLAIRRRHDPVMRGLGFSATMGISAILIHSSVDFNLQIPANAALFVILSALGWIALFQGHNHRPQKESII